MGKTARERDETGIGNQTRSIIKSGYRNQTDRWALIKILRDKEEKELKNINNNALQEFNERGNSEIYNQGTNLLNYKKTLS